MFLHYELVTFSTELVPENSFVFLLKMKTTFPHLSLKAPPIPPSSKSQNSEKEANVHHTGIDSHHKVEFDYSCGAYLSLLIEISLVLHIEDHTHHHNYLKIVKERDIHAP